MFDAETTALLRTVLDEVCDGISRYETGVRAHVASQILETARQGELTIDGLKQAGSKALSCAPTMWR
jgi:hypothetical protein